MSSVYQSADESWIYFDGVAKRRFETEQEARMAERKAAEVLWTEGAREIQGLMQQLMTRAAALSALWQGNPEIWALLQATANDQPVGVSTMLKGDMCKLLAAHAALAAATEQTITVTYHDGTETPATEQHVVRALLNRVA